MRLSLLGLPSITANDPTDARVNSGVANGTVDGLADFRDATVKVYFGTTDGGTDPGAWARSLTVGERGVGSFSKTLKGLPSNSTIHYRFTVANRGGYQVWSDPKTFNTLHQPGEADPRRRHCFRFEPHHRQDEPQHHGQRRGRSSSRSTGGSKTKPTLSTGKTRLKWVAWPSVPILLTSLALAPLTFILPGLPPPMPPGQLE